ncbi:hypothetical protein HMPREF0645_2603 [Hallella bergensis DSM 17361]|uniref:DUF3127 domain-containing protein n=1 Tax=Hallella bergensis DSM 17361 TaxID=585502 RepID=D1Q068_9BACT|nr:DUF3127 domain-containing protein [Hallella bergensis]EFA42967.1 hypothetical protein HMPREF0645_2603 [Hallella bergensis DSM 17361]
MAVNTKSGIVLEVGQREQITSKNGKTYTKRALYIDCTPHDYLTGERSQYENKIQFEFMESKTSLLDNIIPGQVVTVSFDLQGTEMTGQDGQVKRFVHVRPFGIEVRQPVQQAPQQYVPQPTQQYQPQPQEQQFQAQTDESGEPMKNDLPF